MKWKKKGAKLFPFSATHNCSKLWTSLSLYFHIKSNIKMKQKENSEFVHFSCSRVVQKWKMIFKFFCFLLPRTGKPGKRWFDLVSCCCCVSFFFFFGLALSPAQQGTQELSCIISGNMTLIVWVFIITCFFCLFFFFFRVKTDRLLVL